MRFRLSGDLWERSVRATHHFLNESDVAEIKSKLQPDYFPCVELFATLDGKRITGFVGLSDAKIEMLFVDSDCIGCGYGSMLVDFAKKRGIDSVDVNEQNPAALAFYKSKGFRVTGRDECDEAGRPFPILHLTL